MAPSPTAPQAHWLFCVLALLFGGAYALLTPPNASPDEMAHQVKVARVAGGNLFGIDPRLPMPEVANWYGPFDNDRMGSGPLRFRGAEVLDVVSKELDCRSEDRVVNDQVSSYSPVLYALPAAAYGLSCRLHLSFGSYLYGARLANLLLSVALIAAGIAASSLTRWPIFFAALLPSSLYELASISADALLIAFGMLYVAAVAGTALGEIGARRGLWLVTALGVLVSFSKPSYYWMSWLGFAAYPCFRRALLPHWLLVACLAVAPLLSQAALLLLGFNAAAAALPDGVDPRANLQVLLHRPWRLFAMLARVPSAFPFGTQWNLYESLVGKVGWLSVPLPPAVYGLGAVGFPAAACAGRALPVPPFFRLVAVLVALSSVVVIALPLYLYANTVESTALLGLQGRYFLPTVAILLAGCSFGLRGRAGDAARCTVVAVSVALSCASLICFLRVYYA